MDWHDIQDCTDGNGLCPCGEAATRTVRLDLFELDLCDGCLEAAAQATTNT